MGLTTRDDDGMDGMQRYLQRQRNRRNEVLAERMAEAIQHLMEEEGISEDEAIQTIVHSIQHGVE